MTTLIGVNTRNIKAEDVVDVIEDTAAGDTTAARKFVSGLSDDIDNYDYNKSNKVVEGIESGSNAISDLSNKAVKHPMNDHMPVIYAKQLQYMSKEATEQYLSYKTFFNSNWTDEQVREALNFGYKEALNSGVTTGKYSFKYLGENVTVCLEEGIFKTGYGDYVYAYDELLKLLGGK